MKIEYGILTITINAEKNDMDDTKKGEDLFYAFDEVRDWLMDKFDTEAPHRDLFEFVIDEPN